MANVFDNSELKSIACALMTEASYYEKQGHLYSAASSWRLAAKAIRAQKKFKDQAEIIKNCEDAAQRLTRDARANDGRRVADLAELLHNEISGS